MFPFSLIAAETVLKPCTSNLFNSCPRPLRTKYQSLISLGPLLYETVYRLFISTSPKWCRPLLLLKTPAVLISFSSSSIQGRVCPAADDSLPLCLASVHVASAKLSLPWGSPYPQLEQVLCPVSHALQAVLTTGISCSYISHSSPSSLLENNTLLH